MKEIKAKLWAESFAHYLREGNDHDNAVRYADQVIEDFSSRFPDGTFIGPTHREMSESETRKFKEVMSKSF